MPTGFLRIKRHVLEKMAAASTKFKSLEDGVWKDYYNIFEMGPGSDGQWYGEDDAFCRKWADMGGLIWVDPDIQFTHRGTKKWTAKLLDHLDGEFFPVLVPEEKEA